MTQCISSPSLYFSIWTRALTSTERDVDGVLKSSVVWTLCVNAKLLDNSAIACHPEGKSRMNTLTQRERMSSFITRSWYKVSEWSGNFQVIARSASTSWKKLRWNATGKMPKAYLRRRHTHAGKQMTDIHLHNLCSSYVCNCIHCVGLCECDLISAAQGLVSNISHYNKHTHVYIKLPLDL